MLPSLTYAAVSVTISRLRARTNATIIRQNMKCDSNFFEKKASQFHEIFIAIRLTGGKTAPNKLSSDKCLEQ